MNKDHKKWIKNSSSYLAHYNPNHDKLGRFARAVGGSSDTVLRKGTKFNRISGTKKENGKNHLTYVSKTKLDDKLYTSQAGYVFGNYEEGSKNYKHQLVTKKDIKVAGRQAQAKEFAKILSNTDPDKLVEHTKHLDPSMNENLRKYVKDKDDLKRLYKKATKNEKAFKIAFDAFIQNLDNRGDTTQKFINGLKNDGYQALSDEYDTKYKNKPGLIDYYDVYDGKIYATTIHSDSATIFLDRNENLKTVKVSEIKKSDVKRAEDWLIKNGYVSSVFRDRG